MNTFSLVPFPGETVDSLAVHGTATLGPAGLAVTFLVEGPLAELVIPAPVIAPARRDNLWQATCLEVFIARDGEPGYLECNLSPAGHWNLYAFSGYRQGMRQAEGATTLAVHSTRTDGQLTVATTLPLSSLTTNTARFRLGVSAVLLRRNGRCSHWALAHPGPNPDFHAPEGFLFRLQ